MTHTTKVKNAQQFNNIPTDHFQSNADYELTESGVVLATRKTQGRIVMSSFAFIQLIHGAEIIDKASHKLVAKLAISMMSLGAATNIELDLTRDEVVELRKLLEARMLHCEKERDERNPKFNPDTYIMQKYLLLDIREWLMIEAIGEFKPEQVIEPVGIQVTGEIKVYNDLEYWVINSSQYNELKDPQFLGQTSADEYGVYWMFWLADKTRYATKNSL